MKTAKQCVGELSVILWCDKKGPVTDYAHDEFHIRPLCHLIRKEVLC